MIAPLSQLHDEFLSILSQIQSFARFSFRELPPHDRDELVAEVVAYAWASFVRLSKRGKCPTRFVAAFARYSVLSIKAGKLIGQRCNRRDLVSPYRRKPKGFRVVSLETASGYREPPWRDLLTETRQSTPADTAASRIDFAGWLRGLKRRNRRIAEALAAGFRPLEVARKFKVSPARISQIREEFRRSWAEFHGDVERSEAELAAA